MINSKCSEKQLRKKKRSPMISVPDNKFGNGQRSMNELKYFGDNYQQNDRDVQESKSYISVNNMNKARSSQQKFTNYKNLISEYEKYKVKKVDKNSIENQTRADLLLNDNSIYTQTQQHNQKVYNNSDNRSLFNKITIMNQRRQNKKQRILNQLNNQIANFYSIKKYSSMKNLLQKSKLISSPKVQHQTKLKRQQSIRYQEQQDRKHNLCKKSTTYINKYKSNQYQQTLIKEKQSLRTKDRQGIMNGKQSMVKNKVIKQKIPNQLIRYYNVKSNNTIKQLQHKYMLLSQNYNKSLKHSKQINQLFEKQKQHLLKIKTQHFQNQQLIDQLMDQVRNRNYLCDKQINQYEDNYVSYLNGGEEILKRKVDINVQTQFQPQRLNVQKYNQSYKDNNMAIKVEQNYNNKKSFDYLEVNQPFQPYYQNIKSYVQTYQVLQQENYQVLQQNNYKRLQQNNYKRLQQEDNQKYQHSISSLKQQDSHSISQLKRDLFNVKNIIHQHFETIQKQYTQQNTHNIDIKPSSKLKTFNQLNNGTHHNNKTLIEKYRQKSKDQLYQNTKKQQKIHAEQSNSINKVIKPSKYRFQPSISISLQQ